MSLNIVGYGTSIMSSVKLSICIPTFNRAKCLVNCLESILLNVDRLNLAFQICVSDNCSTDDTEQVVRAAQERMPIDYQRNSKNVGIPQNFLNVVEMAKGDFVWLIGDDDLLMPMALKKVIELIENNPCVDYFYINAFHLTTEFVFKFPQPFNTNNLPSVMQPFSSWSKGGEIAYLDLVNPRISFDFMGGMFLAVFRRKNWFNHVDVLHPTAIQDLRLFSHFDNTFPHVKIFAKAFAQSRAYFYAEPLSVCLTGAREWSPMYPFIHSVRLIEALEEYRKNGLPWIQFIRCKNFALNNFVSDFVSMILHRDNSGIRYINPFKLVLKNCLYPNCYLSFFYYIGRKTKAFLRVILRSGV